MRKLCAVVMLVGTLTSCASGEEDDFTVRDSWELSRVPECPIGSPYIFHVDPALDDRHTEGLRVALATWDVQMDRLFPHEVSYSPEASTDEFFPCEVKVRGNGTSRDGFYAWAGARKGKNGRPVGGTITVQWKNIGEAVESPNFEKSLFLHEVGHVLGLEHDENKNYDSIMRAGLVASGKLGCEDVRKVCKIWGCTPSCTGNGWIE